MLVVRVELHSAVTGKVTEIAKAIIYNKGDGTHTHGNYAVRVFRKNKVKVNGLLSHVIVSGDKKFFARVGEVLNYPRLSYNVWRLVARGLLSAFPEERRGAEVAQVHQKGSRGPKAV